MGFRIKSILVISILFCNIGFAQKVQPSYNIPFNKEVSEWFSAWELISKDVYHLKKLQPVDFVFFDTLYVYSTSSVTIPKGEIIKGPKLLGHMFVWKKTLHNDSLTLPDMSRVAVGLMSFASENPGQKKPFFVMPLPPVWANAGVSSKEFGLNNLITGVFVHEFSHSQQMQNFGKRITEFEKTSNFGIEFSDDVVQNLFDKDSLYISYYNTEVNTFYKAVSAVNKNEKDSLIQRGIDLLRKRESQFFTGKYDSLSEIDDFFLTMEGLGQFTIYKWLTNKKGGNLPPDLVITGVRRSKKWWSQDEGFALFLLLSQLAEPRQWAKQMFGDKTESVINLIINQLKKK